MRVILNVFVLSFKILGCTKKMHVLFSMIFLLHSSKAILIFIRYPQSGSNLQAIEVPDDGTVSDIKSIIAIGLEPRDYVLMHNAQILCDEQSLADSGICAEALRQ